jgi:hypothetical protein
VPPHIMWTSSNSHLSLSVNISIAHVPHPALTSWLPPRGPLSYRYGGRASSDTTSSGVRSHLYCYDTAQQKWAAVKQYNAPAPRRQAALCEAVISSSPASVLVLLCLMSAVLAAAPTSGASIQAPVPAYQVTPSSSLLIDFRFVCRVLQVAHISGAWRLHVHLR